MSPLLPLITVCAFVAETGNIEQTGSAPSCILPKWEECSVEPDQCACLGTINLETDTDCDELTRLRIQAFQAGGCRLDAGTHSMGDVDDEMLKGAQTGDLAMVQAALAENASYINRTYFGHGVTAIMAAAREGQTATVKLLIENNADIHAQDNDGWSALMYSAEGGHPDTTKVLLEAGANLTQRTVDGNSALDFAVEAVKGHEEFEKAEADPEDPDYVAYAAEHGARKERHAKVTEMLTKHSEL